MSNFDQPLNVLLEPIDLLSDNGTVGLRCSFQPEIVDLSNNSIPASDPAITKGFQLCVAENVPEFFSTCVRTHASAAFASASSE